MNRKEAIKELEEYIRDCLKNHEYNVDSGFGEMSYNHQKLEIILNYLQQPLTLADLLGWEEGDEYEYRNSIYKLQNEIIYHQYGYKKNLAWEEVDYHINSILKLQEAEKVEKSKKDDLLDELQNLVSSERINEIIEELRELENE